MTGTIFKEVQYTLSVLISNIGLSPVGLPDIQGLSVRANAKVTGNAHKQKVHSLPNVDGQQRRTSLYTIIHREAVLRESLERKYICNAF